MQLFNKKLGIVLLLTALLVMTTSLTAYHYRHINARLKVAETRIGWLEPDRPFVGIEPRAKPHPHGEYNPAEFILLADEKNYRRPYYHWQVHTETTEHPDWCYVPRLAQINQHRLFMFTAGGSFFSDLWGILQLKRLPAGWYDDHSIFFVALNVRVKDVFWNGEDLMLVATPTPSGYQVIKVKNNGVKSPTAWLLDSSFEVWEQAYR